MKLNQVIVALATSTLLWAVMAAQVPMIAQAKAPNKCGGTGRVSRKEWDCWDGLKVYAAKAFKMDEGGLESGEKGCTLGLPAADPVGWNIGWKAAAAGATLYAKDFGEMAAWGRKLSGRSHSYPRNKQHFVLSASKEIASRADVMVKAWGKIAAVDEELNSNAVYENPEACNVKVGAALAIVDFNLSEPHLTTGFGYLVQAGLR
jgi:hypothetical protein